MRLNPKKIKIKIHYSISGTIVLLCNFVANNGICVITPKELKNHLITKVQQN